MSNLLSEISPVVPTPSSAVFQLPPSPHAVSSDPMIVRYSKLFDAFDRAFGKHPTLASPLHTITTPAYLAQLLQRYCQLSADAACDLVLAVGPAGTLGELLARVDQLHGIAPTQLFS